MSNARRYQGRELASCILMMLDARSCDGNAMRALSTGGADHLFAITDWVARRLRITVDGMENIPPGRALLVANHAFG